MFVDVFAQAREIAKLNVTVLALGEPSQGVLMLIEDPVCLVDWSRLVICVFLRHAPQHGRAVCEVDPTVRARDA